VKSVFKQLRACGELLYYDKRPAVSCLAVKPMLLALALLDVCNINALHDMKKNNSSKTKKHLLHILHQELRYLFPDKGGKATSTILLIRFQASPFVWI
jgi:hypothetical protein